jgi:hypothetical protein
MSLRENQTKWKVWTKKSRISKWKMQISRSRSFISCAILAIASIERHRNAN